LPSIPVDCGRCLIPLYARDCWFEIAMKDVARLPIFSDS
jgi:hypothetical protein